MQFENLPDWPLRIILWPLQSYETLWKRTSKSQSLPRGLWSANDLEKLLDQIPAELNKFHLVLFTGSESPYCSQRARSGGVCKSRYLPGKIYLQPLELPKHIILSKSPAKWPGVSSGAYWIIWLYSRAWDGYRKCKRGLIRLTVNEHCGKYKEAKCVS